MQRPTLKRFDDVCGQSEAVRYLRAQASSEFVSGERARKPGASVLIHGPVGASLGAIGKLYARALTCMQGDAPCGHCRDCKDFQAGQHPDHRVKNGGRLAENDAIRMLSGIYAPRAWNTVLISESHLLSVDSYDALYDVIKAPPRRTSFILLTHSPSRLPARVAGILQPVSISPPTSTERKEFLVRAAQDSSTQCTDESLSMLARFSPPGFAPARRDFERLATEGPITEARVRTYFAQEQRLDAAKYLEAVVDGKPLKDQISLLDGWGASPEEKVTAVQSVLDACFRRAVLEVSAHHLDLMTEPYVGIQRMANVIDAWAKSRNLSVRQAYEAVLEFWAPDIGITRGSLLALASRFDGALNAPPAIAPGAAEAREDLHRLKVRRTPSGKRRPSKASETISSSSSDSEVYLTERHVEEIWSAASFMVQEFGCLLNTRITIRFDRLGLRDEAAAAELLTRLCQQARQRLAGRDQLFHYIYVNERRSNGLVTNLAAFTDKRIFDIGNWLKARFIPREAPKSQAGAVTVRSAPPSLGGGARARHIALLKLLSRGIAADLLVPYRAGELDLAPRKLIDLIDVPGPWRGGVGLLNSMHRYATSRHLAARAREAEAKAGFPVLSAFQPAGWDFLRKMWELEEHKFRQSLKKRREAERAEVEKQWAGPSSVDQANLERQLKAWQASWPRSAEQQHGRKYQRWF